MPNDIQKPAFSSVARRAALATALGALCVSAQSVAARQTAVHPHRSASAAMKSETVEQHISMLHTALKITPSEEPDWRAVADVMRTNEAAMQRLIAQRKVVAPNGINAVDDMITYEKFNRAHVDGLKDLISSFATLYNTMPDPQKALADRVFQRSHRHGLQAVS